MPPRPTAGALSTGTSTTSPAFCRSVAHVPRVFVISCLAVVFVPCCFLWVGLKITVLVVLSMLLPKSGPHRATGAQAHPGGGAILTKYAGKDATAAFDAAGHPADIAASLGLGHLRIGSFVA